MGNYPEKWKGYYLTAYGIAVKHGFQGSEEDWLQYLKAGEMELKYEDGLLQWKTSKEAGWHTLEEFSLLQEQLEESAQKASTAAGAAVLAGQEAQAAGQEAQTAAASATRAAGQALEAKAAAEQAAEAAENTAEAVAESALNTANTAAQTAVDTANAAAQSALDTANSAAQTALAQGEYAKAQGDRAAQLVDEIEETDVGGMAADILELQSGKADLVEGKVPVGQIPALGYDPAGSAASVQAGLSAHLNDTDNPHGVTAAQVGVTAKRTCRFVVGTSTNGWTQDDCDYLCDGVDDQVEIQAAIDALPERGGEVVILSGVYKISNQINISLELAHAPWYRSVVIRGEGFPILQKNYNTLSQENMYLIKCTSGNTSGHRVVIDSLELDGNHSNFSNGFSFGIYSKISHNLSYQNQSVNIIQNVHLHNFRNSGIVSNGIVANCWISNISGAGVEIDQGIVSNNIFSYNSGVDVVADNSVVIGNRHSYVKESPYGTGINVRSGNLIIGNMVFNKAYEITMPYTSKYNLVTGNYCILTENSQGNYSTINTAESSTNNFISNNLLIGKDYTNTAGPGNIFTNNQYFSYEE